MKNNNTNIVSRNEAFLKKIRDIVLKNLENETFGVVELSKESGYSRSQLYRKIKSISGKSIIDFINCLRLEEALKLLVNDAGSISEIAYKAGFNSPNYFSRTFNKKYGHAPTEIKEMVAKEGKVAVLEKFGGVAKGEIKKKKRLNIFLLAGFGIVALAITIFLNFNNHPEQLKPVLKHSYTFDDGTGNDVVGAAHGTLKEGVKISNGLSWTFKEGQYIDLPADNIKINEYSSITLEAFLWAGKGNGTFTMISFFGNTFGAFGVDYVFQSIKTRYNSATGISCMNYEKPWETATRVVANPDLQDGKFHHIVTTYDNVELKYYMDGSLVGIQQNNYPEANIIENLSNDFAYLFKSGFPGDETWIGAIDTFNIYEGVLDAETIAKTAKKYKENSDYNRIPKEIAERIDNISN
ncbi:helix-turn-helix domain-containing protein [Tamlana flava]|uniref:helix-turn-helix domain-containing protein n=1 Tax=Tamlana flava TaxID=3158572 RepID=UPI00351B619B